MSPEDQDIFNNQVSGGLPEASRGAACGEGGTPASCAEPGPGALPPDATTQTSGNGGGTGAPAPTSNGGACDESSNQSNSASEGAGSQAAALQAAVGQRYQEVIASQSIRQRGPV